MIETNESIISCARINYTIQGLRIKIKKITIQFTNRQLIQRQWPYFIRVLIATNM